MTKISAFGDINIQTLARIKEWLTLDITTIYADNVNIMAPAANTYEILKSGYYLLNFSIRFNDVLETNPVELGIGWNMEEMGTTWDAFNGSSHNRLSITSTTIQYLNAGKRITLNMYQTFGTPISIYPYSNNKYSIMKIG